MKKLILSSVVIFALVGMILAFNSLKSTTYIKPNESFVLGKNKHNGYRANLKNKGKVDIQVFIKREGQNQKSLGVLKPSQKGSFKIQENTTAIFKNLGSKTAVIGISLNGDTGLSVGYEDN